MGKPKTTKIVILDEDKNPIKLKANIRREIEGAMEIRHLASGLKVEMEDLNTEANGILLPILAAYDVGTYKVPDLGTCYKKTSSGSKIDVGALLIGMMEEGLDSDTAKRIIKAASKSWSTEYVEFRRAK